ncbi:heavy-metal-associated domain-containing protein [Peredibacter starrii]|uniref:Heavy-metal-associated domain-containing protein n=1 Tax=Peredibacter starrii TaxID=28202 RepID=A0AAX4HL43_9BACT|nr:heavy-metal-associated domain-containing protein [Peredibacter starrii]WPU63988.1 heavy-metal-associated domain-containing protein [Peredibacter starrii]
MKISSFFVGLFLSVSVFAARVEVEVNGMSCGMCIESITKEFKSTEKAENISVSLEDKKARFTEVKDKKMSDGEIRSIIKRAGYETGKIRRY